MRRSVVFALVATACGGERSLPVAPPPHASLQPAITSDASTPSANPSHTEASAPPRSIREFHVVGKQVVLHVFDIAPVQYVEAISVGSEQMYPPLCDAPAGPDTGLCSVEHRALRSWEGKGKDLRLVATRAREQSLDLLFAAVFVGSSECGAYGYWLLRIGPTATRATKPVLGCTMTPNPEGDEPEPVVRWGPPVSIRIIDGWRTWRRLELNPRTLDWSQVAKGL